MLYDFKREIESLLEELEKDLGSQPIMQNLKQRNTAKFIQWGYMLDLLDESEAQLKARIKDGEKFGVSKEDIEELLKIGVEGAHYPVNRNK